MRRGWRPILIGGAVAAGTFALAKAQIFEPSAPAGVAVTGGDIHRGETIFQRECAGCHGDQGKGGGVGPVLFETSLDRSEVAAAVQQGGGVMPAGLVRGQEQADVVAYVVSISSPAG
jgi:mono/diheme cytochrome c family protein